MAKTKRAKSKRRKGRGSDVKDFLKALGSGFRSVVGLGRTYYKRKRGRGSNIDLKCLASSACRNGWIKENQIPTLPNGDVDRSRWKPDSWASSPLGHLLDVIDKGGNAVLDKGKEELIKKAPDLVMKAIEKGIAGAGRKRKHKKRRY